MAVNLKKSFSRFHRQNVDITRVFETNFPDGVSNHLPFREGVFTIKVKIERDEFNPKRVPELELSERTVIKGYVEAENANVLHIINPRKKFLKRIVSSYYHAIADDLAEIVYTNSKYPGSEYIIDVSEIRAGLMAKEWDFVGFFLKCLDDQKIKYTLVDLSQIDVLYINDFAPMMFPFHSGARLDLLSEFFKKYVTNPKQKPYRKVFVSRGKMPWREESEAAQNFSYKDDNRIDDHSKIEQVFVDLGFEIMYPEDFENFQEQIDFFYSVKVLASLTSSGIVNAVFMQPGGTVLELVTPLITQSPVVNTDYLKEQGIDPKDYDIDINTVQEIHMFYHNLAFFKEHTYIGIPNYFRSSDAVRKFIDNNKPLKQMLESND